MIVEIWSDVMCPFCYIGKRRFEAALAQFDAPEPIEVIWRSFQLDPNLQTDPHKSTAQSLAEKKGWSPAQTAQMLKHVTDMAEGVGLHYDFDRAVVANSFDAHRFSHYAHTQGKGDAAEERLFAAYFSEGKNTADHETLAEIGAEIGLDKTAVWEVLKNDAFRQAVENDIKMARQIGISGVPFFVFNRKYAVSGAQEVGVFVETLAKAQSNN